MTRPPGLFDRPLLGDALRGLGVAGACTAVIALPPLLLPWSVGRWYCVALAGLALWLTGFVAVRMEREHRRWQAEDAARRAQWAAEDAAWQAQREAWKREPD